MPCKSKAGVRFISQSHNAPRQASQTSLTHQLLDESLSKSAHNVISSRKPGKLKDTRVRAQPKIKLVLDLAAEKGSSVWLTVLPLREMGSNLIKQEFCNAVKLQCGWPVDDIPSTYPRVYADKSVR